MFPSEGGGISKGENGGGYVMANSQFFTSFEVFVIVEKVIPTLAPGARIYATVFTRLG